MKKLLTIHKIKKEITLIMKGGEKAFKLRKENYEFYIVHIPPTTISKGGFYSDMEILRFKFFGGAFQQVSIPQSAPDHTSKPLNIFLKMR